MSVDSKRSSELKKEDLEEKRDLESPIGAHYDPEFVRKTLRLVDWRMLPLLGFLYSVALIDRTNLGIARAAGMEIELKLYIGERYSIASMIYFIPYIILQIPGNIVLRWIGARTWLTICVVGWGIAQLGMGFVKTWGWLVFCRVWLGVFEAGFFPALVFIITTWYKRHEVQKRLAIFYLISILLGGFSSLLAFGIAHLSGRGGYLGWSWIFIIEGTVTIVLGILAWLFVPDFPDKSTFVTDEQRKMILDRVEADRGDSIPDKMTTAKLFHHLSDPIVWIMALMFLCSTMPAYALGFFITIILKSMGYSTFKSLVLTCPPYVFAAISTFVFAYISDKSKQRALWLAVQNLICITGLFITAYHKKDPVRYFGLFLVNAGASGCIPGILAYHSNNITGHTKRSVSTAVIIAAGGVGGIFATMVYRQKDFPKYMPGMWATIGCQFCMFICLGITTAVFWRRNKEYKEGKRGPLESTPGFYYTL
ncbi:putative transporter C11D3.18C [Psilocybe cubensis]|uniref:Transporter C11D3.18C n=2 Tax=Psilocybe cubensis TaxID=181762 RepID=A0ACB8HAH5_PSICU|nr:putative transporter C11D3.18C [Psilocybe cubensis]KAH9485005.1 putative transporter C11D3.18C [Psilocybe cubensis]